MDVQQTLTRFLKRDKMPVAKGRINQLDFLKCLFIALMVVFHLVYIGDKYPYAKAIVYTFHMPAFLMISGYLMNVKKDTKGFAKTIWQLLLPYTVMETGYTVMASLLPIREHIDHLSIEVLAEKIFIHPLGPYWFLHTLMLCDITYYLAFRLIHKNLLVRFTLMGLSLYILSHYLGIINLSCALYFMAGTIIQQLRISFIKLFPASPWIIIPFVLLLMFPENLDKATVPGILIVFLAIGIGLWLFQHTPKRMMPLLLGIGGNTLPILLFSPIFTLLCKFLLPLLQFDPSGMAFLLLSLTISMAGSIGIGYVIDRLGISQKTLGKNLTSSFPKEA